MRRSQDFWRSRFLLAAATLPGIAASSVLAASLPLSPDGPVTARQTLLGTLSEPMNLRRFPFDREVFLVASAWLMVF